MASPADGVWRRFLFPLLALSFLAVALPALAQTAAPETVPPEGQDVVPEATQPQAPATESLSDKLEETRGVIKPPPGVDPEMAMPPPDDGTAAGRIIRPPAPVAPQ